MTPTLVRQHLPHAGPATRVDLCARARDWSEIQERMFVPLYESVYERLEVGTGTRLLGLGCGSGLALLMAASRGAAVTGVEASSPQRLSLARERLLPEPALTRARGDTQLVAGLPEEVDSPAYTLVTAFEPIGCLAGDSERLSRTLAAAVPSIGRGSPVVLVGWGPPERCATSAVLRVAARLADPLRGAGGWRPAHRDDLEEVAHWAGLRPDGSGRVSCPFGYANMGSAVRGLLSTGVFDSAIAAAGQEQVDKELAEALHPYQRRDGTIWMPNVFRYLIARTA
ncbi:class I SAM-dependent methyltransferase [Streptomyces sp. SID12488]|uniref:class I SAM-dependent methyltransferase n=1 Tax=Streptomyces sp. SID12488 TaxID=2706040 RepID=UPI0013DC923E|nr:class I SAM-dependent methyltransferase [Streptomyces sp. SID12488]NEA65290.1 SAM-dependent methyltransferase [Streptomyces sp. SID12488]